MNAVGAPVDTVGVVGLGLVGTALATRLQLRGYRCIGFDVRSEACAQFAAAGHSAVSSAAVLGSLVQTIFLAVMDTADVEAVVNTMLADSSSPKPVTQVTTFIDCSTGDADRLAALVQRLNTWGIDFIEAPLSGSSAQIAQGEATMLLGGSIDAIERHVPLLDAISTQRFHCGGAGMGARAKLATNLVLGLNRAALAEGMVFAEQLGIAPNVFLQMVLGSPARSDAALAKGRKMVDGDFTPQSRIRQHLKDVQLMRDAAARSGQTLPLTEAHARLLQSAVAAGDGDLDNAAVIRQIRRSRVEKS